MEKARWSIDQRALLLGWGKAPGPEGPMAQRCGGVAEGQTELFEQSEKSEGPNSPVSPAA